jgi:hypothetical protein
MLACDDENPANRYKKEMHPKKGRTQGTKWKDPCPPRRQMKANDPPKSGDPKGNIKLHVYYIGTAM